MVLSEIYCASSEELAVVVIAQETTAAVQFKTPAVSI
jgi:hypothetical protein